MAGRQTEIEIRRGKRKRRVSIVANVTNNTSAHTCVVAVIAVAKLTRKNERERSYGCFPFVLPDDKVSTLLFFLLLHHLGAYLSSIIGFTLRLPSDRLPLLCSPPPLQLRPLPSYLSQHQKPLDHFASSFLPSFLRVFRTEAIIILANGGRVENQRGAAGVEERRRRRQGEVWGEAENTTRKWRSLSSSPPTTTAIRPTQLGS